MRGGRTAQANAPAERRSGTAGLAANRGCTRPQARGAPPRERRIVGVGGRGGWASWGAAGPAAAANTSAVVWKPRALRGWLLSRLATP